MNSIESDDKLLINLCLLCYIVLFFIQRILMLEVVFSMIDSYIDYIQTSNLLGIK